MAKRIYYFIIVLIIALQVNAATLHFKMETEAGKALFRINLDSSSKIYWLYAGVNGLPTNIDLSASDNLLAYKIIWPFPNISVNSGSIEDYYYTGEVSIPVYVKAIDENSPILLKATISYLLCMDQCIPITERLEQLININSDFSELKTFSISEVVLNNDQSISFIASLSESIDDIPDFVVNQVGLNFIKDTEIVKKTDRDFLVRFFIEPKQYNNVRNQEFEVYSNKTDLATNITIPGIKMMLLFDLNFWIALFSAFLGGLILNFMPCVLPVLSLKLLSFTRNSANKKRSLALSLLGILCSFFSLALITIALKASGKQFGLGIHFQSPVFIIFLTIILTIFISSCLDRINIDLPSGLRNMLSKHHIKNNYFGDFFGGIVASILSTPCTAPFLGTAMAFALSCNNNISVIIIFMVAGFGFGTPYWLLIFCPKLIILLPKPGKWMVLIKKIIAILLIATLVWLCNILDEQMDLRAVIGLALLLLLLKFVLENNKGQIARSIVKLPIAIMIVVSALYLPNMAYNEDLQHNIAVNSVWQPFDQKEIAKLVDQGKIVVVDITAAWCATCKFNKLIVWDRDKTVKLFRTKKIIAMRADYTNFDQNIQDYLSSNQSYGIPFNKVYGSKVPQGIMLPSIVFYGDLLAAINTVE
ncbi:protein-disulfide reductase DsbD family protein [Candidatus Trichorickettsia mobilis]|uniref:protein-disulfide reductase DsbD family protein n=1 Tax=Candidatus Trichorickettsia mobilis TaxID=1346319 RepID=UPI0029305D14|nr:thioredoxin family protein [Candidatus Trichorickettsia mobilis]